MASQHRTITAESLAAWREGMGFRSQAQAARRLGVSRNTYGEWERKGAPFTVQLACIALWHRLGHSSLPW